MVRSFDMVSIMCTGHANGPGMVSDRASDGLPDPPCGVRRELVASHVLVLVHGTHQAGVAFLNDV